MSNPKKVPSDKWNYKPLNQIATRITEKNGVRTENVLTISSQHGLVSQTQYFNKSVASKNLSGYYYLTKGDFAYNKSYSEGYPFGAIKQLDRYEEGIVSTLYICFRIDSSCSDSQFYKQYYDSGLWNSEVRNIAQEGGRSHGLLNVGVNDFFKIIVPVPPLIEQQKISSILSSVDKVIEKTETIIEQTVKVKKGLMQRLLTKGIGHKEFKETEIGQIPETWSVRKIEEVGTVGTGGTPKRDDSKNYGGAIPWVKTTEIKYSLIMQSEEYITEYALEKSAAKLYPAGTVLLAMYGQGVTRGRCAILGIDAATNQACAAIVVKQEMINKFLYYVLELNYENLRNLGHGSNQSNLNTQFVKSFLVPVPSIHEQENIIKIISSIEDKVMIEMRNLEELKKIKKGLMQSLLTGKVRVKVDEAAVTQV